MLEVLGLSLAVLDFTGLAKKLEAALDSLRQWTQRFSLDRQRFKEALFAFVKFATLMGAMFFVGALLGPYDLGEATVVALSALGLIALAPAVVIFGATICYAILHVLNLPPSGMVGSIGLIVALAGFLTGDVLSKLARGIMGDPS